MTLVLKMEVIHNQMLKFFLDAWNATRWDTDKKKEGKLKIKIHDLEAI